MASENSPPGSSSRTKNGGTPVTAAFSPDQPVSSAASPRQRSTILVHQKSPLLVATPPQITRALAYSYPFLQPLSKVAGLLSWTTGDPWESFLLLSAFWASTLYGDVVIRTTGPLVFAVCLILGMYTRRHSPLSSTGWTSRSKDSDSKTKSSHTRKESQGSMRHHKSLDEIVSALQLFTSRCNILLDPFLRLTDFLSTQSTATSATTRPALTAMFMRILMLMPIWYALTLPPLFIVTTERTVLLIGTLVLTWHSRPARVGRTILWRSRVIRRSCEVITGLPLSDNSAASSERKPPPSPRGFRSANDIAASLAGARNTNTSASGKFSKPEGIRFTFSIYENQRRWIGIGWTSSMLAYERAAWTDDELNPSEPKDRFQLPSVEGGMARWRWCAESRWEVDVDYAEPGDDTNSEKRADMKSKGKIDEDEGWIYYDNKWLHGRRGIDGWGRYTRKRRWVRDAELIEITASSEVTPVGSPTLRPQDSTTTPTVERTDKDLLTPASAAEKSPTQQHTPLKHRVAASLESIGSGGSGTEKYKDTDTTPHKSKRNWFRRKRTASNATDASSTTAVGSEADGGKEKEQRDDSEDDGYVPLQFRGRQGAVEQNWGVGDDAGMDMG